MHEHAVKLLKGFTSRYNINKLVYYEVFDTAEEAIMAEKRIKGWTRQKKINLIKAGNQNFSRLL